MVDIASMPPVVTTTPTDELVVHDSSASQGSRITGLKFSGNAGEFLDGTGQFTASLPAQAEYSTDQVLTAAQCYGGVVFVTGDATLSLPAVAPRMHLTVIVDTASVIATLTANGVDIIRKDGVDGLAGGSVESTGYLGDTCVLIYRSPGKWYASTTGW